MELNLGLTIMSLVSFLVLLWIFTKFFFGPILNNVHMREHSIEKQLKDAADAHTKATSDRDAAEKALAQTREESVKIMDKARDMAEKSRQEIIDKAAKEAHELLINAQIKIEQESRKAFDELRVEVASLALLTAEKILVRSITDTDQQRLVNEVINSKGSAHVG